MVRDEMLYAALGYSLRGWHVFPCAPNDKIPLGRLAPNGVKNATADELTIRRWWKQCPNANIGLACGESMGAIVVDLDGDEGISAWEQLIQRRSPIATLMSRTGSGGCHLFFGYPGEGKIKNSACRLAPKVDTRSDGGYIVAPPSIHPNGNRYTWLVDTEIQPCPDWLVRLFTRNGSKRDGPPPPPLPTGDRDLKPYVEAVLRNELQRMREAPQGARNHQLNRSAYSLGRFVGAGLLSEGSARSELYQAALDAGLTKHETARTIDSGLGSGITAPWEMKDDEPATS